MWCSVMWRGVVWCGVVWCGVVWCGVIGTFYISSRSSPLLSFLSFPFSINSLIRFHPTCQYPLLSFRFDLFSPLFSSPLFSSYLSSHLLSSHLISSYLFSHLLFSSILISSSVILHRPIEESLREFERMRTGRYSGSAATLRMKMDMTSPNPNMWDQVRHGIKGPRYFQKILH